MKSYFGNIEIGKIKNKQTSPSTKKKDDSVFIPINESNVRFVHYPDCQQLTIWLTHPGSEYGAVRLRNKKSKTIVEDWPVSDRLSGSIQIIWDTLPIVPGLYRIEIDWKNGWMHQIDFEKHKEGVAVVKKATEVAVKKGKQSEPIIYRDGFGKIIPDEDLILRGKVHKDIVRRFSRRIEYKGNGRSGTVIYIDNENRIEFINEMGGGNCMLYIEIPTAKQWELQTNTPLSGRKEILEFVAATVQAQQASNCDYEIKNDIIGFYYK